MNLFSAPQETKPGMAPKILVIRRDNIGDLVCTTPLFQALRERFPDAFICALVNSYNVAVLENNPYVDAVHAYTKVKHRAKGENILKLLWNRLTLLVKLRKIHFDYVILAGPGFSKRALGLARAIRPKHIVGFAPATASDAKKIDLRIEAPDALIHEAEYTFLLLSPFGIKGPPGPVTVLPNSGELARVRATVGAQRWPPTDRLIGIHISARKPSQRWPAHQFVELIRHLRETHNASFLLLWSPGDSNNPLHPGDDNKAQEIMTALAEVPILAYPTHRLPQLIGALALCDLVVCSDGGAMHLAAGLGKPILCFFGKSDRVRWHPWGVPYMLLQPENQEVGEITATEATTSFAKLLAKIGV